MSRFGDYGGGGGDDFRLKMTLQVEGQKADASSRSNSAHDMMEGFMGEAQSLMGLLGGLLMGPLQMLGSKKGGGGGKKGG